MSRTDGQSAYAAVNGLDMYYEIHGAGEPLVLLHGGFMTVAMLEPLVSELAQTRQVIAVELEGQVTHRFWTIPCDPSRLPTTSPP